MASSDKILALMKAHYEHNNDRTGSRERKAYAPADGDAGRRIRRGCKLSDDIYSWYL